jgi:hypothetical protein
VDKYVNRSVVVKFLIVLPTFPFPISFSLFLLHFLFAFLNREKVGGKGPVMGKGKTKRREYRKVKGM